MDKPRRKLLHEFANVFGVKSKSEGDGLQRRTCLIRTRKTLEYDEQLWQRFESNPRWRRLFPRLHNGGLKRGRASCSGLPTRGGFVGTAASFRDGEVVGSSAPELGMDNRGRAMLEKMGWSNGTALGALNNKGILKPVQQVVKSTKAGLG